ncbi:hypothetical protein AAG570_007494 [Ranatra chinensis]|uniref:C2H2-type domain-containing protein n=1 Tax=Ranatra chinensis TaxID=642074 RepID=A0ABD0XW08_9HEMI
MSAPLPKFKVNKRAVEVHDLAVRLYSGLRAWRLTLCSVEIVMEDTAPVKQEEDASVKHEILDIAEVYDYHSSIKHEPCSDDDTVLASDTEVFRCVTEVIAPVKLEKGDTIKQETLDIAEIYNDLSPIEDDGKTGQYNCYFKGDGFGIREPHHRVWFGVIVCHSGIISSGNGVEESLPTRCQNTMWRAPLKLSGKYWIWRRFTIIILRSKRNLVSMTTWVGTIVILKGTVSASNTETFRHVAEVIAPIKLEKDAAIKQETLDIAEIYNDLSPIEDDGKTEILDMAEVYNHHSSIKEEPRFDDDVVSASNTETFRHVAEVIAPIKLEKDAAIKQETLDIAEIYNDLSPIEDDGKTGILDTTGVNKDDSLVKDETSSDGDTEILDIVEVYNHHSSIKEEPRSDDDAASNTETFRHIAEVIVPTKLEKDAAIKQETLDIAEIYNDLSPIEDDGETGILDTARVYKVDSPVKDEPSSDGDTGSGRFDASGVANTALFVCHHCGCEADCLDDMRRHMRRHRGLSVRDQVSRVEEVRRDTSMCRGQGEASQLKDVKRGHTGGTLSAANTGVLVCHHCGYEADCLDDMRRHMRRHRGLSVGDQVSRVEEIRRDTSMCRGQGEASQLKDVKRGHTGGTLSAANTGVLVCHHCGYEADCLDDMRRHMRRHRGLSVGDQVSRVEEVRRDTSMCRGQGEASRLRDAKRSKRGKTDRKPFPCHQCGYQTNDMSKLTRHKRIHTGEKPFSCDHCGYQTSQKSDLIVHIRIHTGEKPFSCDQCDFRTGQSSNLIRHKRIHTGEKPFSCDQCDYRTGQSSRLMRHKMVHIGVKPFSCDHCGYQTSLKSDLIVHIRIHNGAKPFSCDQCDFRTGQSSNLIRHKRIHTGEKPFSCDQCDYRTGESSRLTRHKMVHTGVKPFSCDHCGYQTSQKSDLIVHIRIHIGEKPFSCDQCDFRTGQSSHLIRHKRIHTGEKPFSCDQCDYRTGESSRLTRHKMVHTGVKPFSCDQCDYRTNRPSCLVRHKRIHTGEKPFSCDQCDYRTGRSSHLIRHKIVHTGVKPLSCDQCNYQTSLKSSLKVHVRIHTGEKPFSCDQCDFRTGQSSNLIRHKRIHTGEKPFSCDQCDYRAGRSSHLRRHKMVHTGVKQWSDGQDRRLPNQAPEDPSRDTLWAHQESITMSNQAVGI